MPDQTLVSLRGILSVFVLPAAYDNPGSTPGRGTLVAEFLEIQTFRNNSDCRVHSLAGFWQTLQRLRHFRKRLLFRRSRPAAINLVDLLNADVDRADGRSAGAAPARIIRFV